jgi:hypothetical protein
MQIPQEVFKTILSASSDTIIIAVLIGLGFAFSFFLSKRRAVAFLLSFYPSFLIYKFLPFIKQFAITDPLSQNQAVIPVVLFAVIFFVINLVIYQFISAAYSFSGSSKFILSLVLGVLIASFLLVFSYQVVNLNVFHNFSSGIDILFSSANYIWWLIVPFPVLYFLR